MIREETIHYLEMESPDELRPAKTPMTPVEIRRAEIPCPELNRFLYTAVGGAWFWVDRLPWTYDRWLEELSWPGFETWLAWQAGTPAGYYELDGEAGGVIELASFGVLPQFAGKGLGGHLLTHAVRQAWANGATRVWLHTSSFDDPRALGNYLARGFKLIRTETCPKELPDAPHGPWTGARVPRQW